MRSKLWVENSSGDLETTITAYTWLAKLYRLQLIAKHNRVKALKLAVG